MPLRDQESEIRPNTVENTLAVEHAVARLPERLRLVHELRMQDFSHAEIARILGLSARTVVSLNGEIREYLRAQLTRPLAEPKSAAPDTPPEYKKLR